MVGSEQGAGTVKNNGPVEVEKSVIAKDIVKSYKSFFGSRNVVLQDISLDIFRDEIFGILGPNGSGKTTLISIFSTLIYPDSGSLRILGVNARKNPGAIRKLVNISTAKPNFPWSLTAEDNLKYSAMLYGIHGPELKRIVDNSIEAFELGKYRDVQFDNLSTGLKQRLSLAKAMLNDPKIIFLDEPTTGLDPEVASRTRSLIKEIQQRGVSIIMSTHYMPEAEQLCDRIAFLRKGQITALGTPQELKNLLALGEKVTVIYQGPVDLRALEKVPGVMKVNSSPRRVELVLDRVGQAGSLDKVIKIFGQAEILDLRVEEPDMEDVFLELAR